MAPPLISVSSPSRKRHERLVFTHFASSNRSFRISKGALRKSLKTMNACDHYDSYSITLRDFREFRMYSRQPHKWRFSSAAAECRACEHSIESLPSANVRRSGERKSEKRAKEEDGIETSNSKFWKEIFFLKRGNCASEKKKEKKPIVLSEFQNRSRK